MKERGGEREGGEREREREYGEREKAERKRRWREREREKEMLPHQKLKLLCMNSVDIPEDTNEKGSSKTSLELSQEMNKSKSTFRCRVSL